jgi:dihydrofolate reductase
LGILSGIADLVYSAIASLDGFVADEQGDFRWAAPDEEVQAFVNDLERSVGTYLYGRRMYEVMAVWETMATAGEPEVVRDYAEIWRAANKVVYSTTLDAVSTTRTRLERRFDPVAVAAMKEVADRPIGIGGPRLAGVYIRYRVVRRAGSSAAM